MMNLLAAISITSILATMAVPQVSEMTASFERLNIQSEFDLDLKRAQIRSISEGCRGIVTIASGGGSYSFGCDFLPYDTTVPPAADSGYVYYNREMPTNFTVGSSETIIFNSRGRVVDKDGFYTSPDITYYEDNGGTPTSYASSTLSLTGVITYN